MRLFVACCFMVVGMCNQASAEGNVVVLGPGKGDPLAEAVRTSGHPCPELKLFQSIHTNESYRISRVWCGPQGDRFVDLRMDYRLTRVFSAGDDPMYAEPWNE